MNISSLLLHAVSRGFTEIILKKGTLPLLIRKDAKHYAPGMYPLSGRDIETISKRYLESERDIVSINVQDREFLVFKEGADIVFRYLAYIQPKDEYSAHFKSACFADSGIIMVNGRDTEQRTLGVYQILSFINKNRTCRINILENKKFYSLKPLSSMINFFFNPRMDLAESLRLFNLSGCDVLAMTFYKDDVSDLIRDVSKEKLVIIATSQNHSFDFNNILYIVDMSNTDTKIAEQTAVKPKINWGVLMENVKGSLG